jgi:hypothetical protein
MRFQLFLAKGRGSIPGYIFSRRDDRIAAEKFVVVFVCPL